MRLSIPVFVETTGSETSAKTRYSLRPLYHDGRVESHPLLSQAKTALARWLREKLGPLAKDQRHHKLAAWTFHPEAEHRTFAETLELRDKRVKVRLPLVTFRRLGRTLAFCPKLPSVWFELGDDDDLHARAREVFTRYFRESERDGIAEEELEAAALRGKSWIATVDVELPSEQAPAKKETPWATLWNTEPLDGSHELHRVGRCLDALYPDALPRAVRRDREVSELDRWLASSDRRPVVIVGPRLVGKTAMIHETVRRRVERKLAAPDEVVEGRRTKKKKPHDEQTWLLSPQRLVSGMMFVGQWEDRLTAIVKHAAKRDHVLYFDNFLGLYQAGQSRDASLSMADVLRTYIQDRRVRVLTEMTAEAFHVWQERDRGLADQFHVLRIGETSEEETLRVLLSVVRELEAFHRTAFERGVVPAVVEIQRRYVPDAAFPGKAAAFLRQLATKFADAPVGVPAVYEEFHAQTGLSLGMLSTAPLDSEQVRRALADRVVGQRAAVQASVDVVALAKARLTSQQRPLASLLFLGPTGVGKTQCAKALAEYLFSDADKVLRFDMNEYSSSAAVARLVGTATEPEGLLTSAVRRRPFCVVLLDEIEKAHPDVFDLLLQVTGEARLTDALGRTTDFSNAILILTSNLGAREAAASLGFGSDSSRDSVYVAAAERFFRPEFFNRLDRVVPFSRLDAGEIRRIADYQLRELFRRDGLTRRNCVLSVSPDALDAVAERGYHPQFGARALKRSVEQSIARPLAARLTSLDPELPVLVSLYRCEGEPALHVQSLPPASATPTIPLPTAPAESIAKLQKTLAVLERRVVEARPTVTTVDYAQQGDYYVLREQIAELTTELREFADSLEPGRAARGVPVHGTHARGRRSTTVQGGFRRYTGGYNPRQLLKEGISAEDVERYVEETAGERSPSEIKIESRLAALRRRLTLLAAASDPTAADGALLVLEPTSQSRLLMTRLLATISYYKQVFDGLELDSQWPRELSVNDGRVEVDGFVAIGLSGRIGAAIARREVGVHLFPLEGEGLGAVRAAALPLSPGETFAELTERFETKRREWRAALDDGRARPEDDPFPPGEVVRTYHAQRTIDLRTAASITKLDVSALQNTLVDGLPDPLALV